MLRDNIFGWSGIALGGLALLLAMIHFYGGPFTPQQTLESLVAGKAAAIKESLLASLTGQQIPEKVSRSHYNVDRIVEIVIAVLAVGAVVLGAAAGGCKENPRAISAAVMLGMSTLTFQIGMFAFGIIMVLIVIALVLVLSLILDLGAVC